MPCSTMSLPMLTPVRTALDPACWPKKFPPKKVQPVFFKILPDGDAPKYFQLVNNLTKLGLTMADFYRASASVKDQ